MEPLILIIEDEILIAHDIRQILEEEGYRTLMAHNGKQAKAALAEYQPALVLIDINLGHDREGLEIGQLLLARDRIPYIYITSNTDRMTLDGVKETRPQGFIAKPFKPIDIKTTVAITLFNNTHRLLDPARAEKQLTTDAPFRLRRTVDFINQNISNRIELDEVAELSQWNKSYFIRMFTKYLGVTPYQYILRRKIEKAMILLADSDLSASDIAFELGFESYKNFSIAFRRIAGMAPDAYRRTQQAQR